MEIIVVLTGVRVLRDASLQLMDTMPAAEMIERLRASAEAVPSVSGVDKIYAWKAGFKYHVDLHVEVDSEFRVAASHVIGGQVRSSVRAQLGWVADVLVHIEPATPAAAEGRTPPQSPRR